MAIGLACLGVLLAHVLVQAQRLTAGCLVYPLDDSYIHMALAKNLSQHAVWGVRPDRFCSASSSPLWTLLLSAIYATCGCTTWAPLFLALLCACGILATVSGIAGSEGWPSWLTALILLALIAWTPLVPLTFSGMEHTLHTWLCVLFLYGGVNMLARPRQGRIAKGEISLCLIVPALALVRYESLFLVFAFCLICTASRRWKTALTIALLAALPVVVFGLISLWQDGYFLPNSILRKAFAAGLHSTEQRLVLFGLKGFVRLVENAHLWTLVIALLSFVTALALSRARLGHTGMLLCILLPSLWLHLHFAAIGWYYRYEAYLVGMAITALGSLSAQYLRALPHISGWRRLTACMPLAALTAVVIGNSGRAAEAIRKSPQAAQNIHDQQCQMARFLARNYPGEGVALNDIGAVCYFARSKVLDLWGLADNDVLAAVRNHTFTTRRIAELCQQHHVQAIVIYPSWFRQYGGLPRHWIPVGAWKIRNNVICGGAEVRFFAPGPAQAKRLAQHLHDFAASLPTTVESTLYRDCGDLRRFWSLGETRQK